MTSPVDPPACDNGPHSAPADSTWQDRIWRRLDDGRWQDRIWHRLDDGRLVCGGCWNVGGILNDPKGETDG